MILQRNTDFIKLHFCFYNVNKPQEDSFEALQFNYFKHIFCFMDTLLLSL